MRKLLTLFTALLFVGTMWATEYELMLTLDVTKGAPSGSTSTALTDATLLSYLKGAAPSATNISAASISADVYKGKGSGGGSIPQACLKIGKASGGGSITFTIANSFDDVAKVELVGYGWSTNTKVAVNSSSTQSPTTAQTLVTFPYELATPSKTISIAVTSSAFCATAIKLYKEVVHVNSLSIKTAPTKLNYKVGEVLDLTGLVLTADDKDVTSGYTASPANGATLNSVGAQTVAITYGGKTVNQTIHVGELKSIAITTDPTKTEYNQGQTFDPTGMVVEATFSDKETTPTEWTEEVDDYTYSPTTALQPENTNVTVSYEWATVEKTANQAITVNAATAYTVTFDAGTGSCATASLTEPSGLAGVELPTATIGIAGWSFAGWAEASVTNTEVEPTLYAAGNTYHPVENCTLYAVYEFSSTSATQFAQATSLSDITGASKIVIVNGSYALDNTLGGSVNAPTVTDGIMEPAAKFIFTLSGNNTDGFTLTNGTKRLGAVSSSNVTLATDASNYLWTFAKIGETTNFQVLSKSITGEALERYKPKSGSYNWKTYDANTTDIYQMKIYVPNIITVYNSSPAAIVTPTVAFTTAGDKNLYVQDEASYTNVANVTGIAKSPVYSSSDETVATVSEAGVVTALKAGSATITAKVEEEIGVNTEAKATYNVTVKDAKTIAGLKALTSTATAKSFTADLTDAVVTYVNGNYAYIQDASGAVYASCGNSLTAGKKINGAVTGSIKASNQIDEITAINLESATVTDGVIPSAAVISAAELAANKADYEGKLVSIENATVTASLTSGSASGGKISDDDKTTEINLYAPASNIEALKDAEGTFNGYISLYSGTTIRFNIYEQSQITVTKNAPTDQPLAFDEDEVVLDHPSTAFENFEGQTVSGNKTTPVVYSIDSDVDGVVTSIDGATGIVELSGIAGTATIKVTAPADDGVDEHDIPTPWNETSKTYTITVRQLYTVTWNVNGVETTQMALEGTTLTPPSASAIPGKVYQGWTDAAIDGKTDTKPTLVTLTTMPAKDTTLYALYATANEESQLKEFSYTITTSDFPKSGYDANDGDRDVKAVCTSDATLKVDVQWTSYKMCENSSKIQGKSTVGKIYNKSRWGKGIKSVSFEGTSTFSYVIGASSQPTESAAGAFFQISSTGTSTATSITITFDSTINVTTYDAYITNAYVVTYDANGGSCATASATYVGTPLVLPEATHATLYFVGWYDEEEGGNKIGYAGNEYTPTADITLYAHWSETEPTGFDNTEVDAKAVKVMRNGILYIEKNGKTYNAQGQLVK